MYTSILIDASFMERRYCLKGKPASAELFEQSKVMIFTQLQTKGAWTPLYLYDFNENTDQI